MLVLIFTYCLHGVRRAACRQSDECAYLLVNADPTEHGGQWDCIECTGLGGRNVCSDSDD